MSTPAEYKFVNQFGEVCASVYQHSDGFWRFAGFALACFLIEHQNDEIEKLAARFVAERFKYASLYLQASLNEDSYIYTIYETRFGIRVDATNGEDFCVGMNPEQFLGFIERVQDIYA